MPTIRSLLSLLCILAALVAHGEDDPESASDTGSKKEKAKPAVTTISGVFEAIKTHPLSAGTEQVKSLKIKRIVPHGSVVSKGQGLVWFETESIDQQLKAASSKLRLAELSSRDDDFAYQQFIETQQLDRAAADRSHKKSNQAYDNYVQVDHERDIASAHFNLKNANASLANVMEELTQLEQMYKEDDLTEESEEIVLKRAKQAVENAQFRLRGNEISTNRTLTQSIPQSQAEKKDSLTRAQLAHAKAILDLTSARQRRDIERAKKRDELEKERRDFKQLQGERKQLVIQSPAAGIVFHGKLSRGKVSEKPTGLVKGSAVTNAQVIVTLAEPKRLQIRVDLQEKDLSQVTVGARGKVKVAAYPDRQLTATVKSISAVPYAGTKFDCLLSVKAPKSGFSIVPGMSCTIEFAAPVEDAKKKK